MGFNSIKKYIENQVYEGKHQLSAFRKYGNFQNSPGLWYDLSIGAGNPSANYYASDPLVSKLMPSLLGIYTGQNVSPETKHLSKLLIHFGVGAVLPFSAMLLDYIMYYPFIDMSSTDEQFLSNTVTLPRYADGKGVRAILVSQGAYTGGQQYFINYTNQNGVSGRISPTCTSSSYTGSSGGLGSLVSSYSTVATPTLAFGPFIPLQAGDTGIRSVESITTLGDNGGIASLVLVRPIANINLKDNTCAHERDFYKDQSGLPKIEDGACLNFICSQVGSISNNALMGVAEFTWS